jgi:hypothetical protein
MGAPNVDLALVIDTSQSMKNCFDQLRQHLDSLLTPMQGNVSRIRYALVGASASKSENGGFSYRISFLHGPWDYTLYNHGPNDGDPRNKYFTDEPSKVKQVLASWEPSGDEDMLLALDVAADLPFGPLSNTKRVIALFSDEPFESGVSKSDSNHHLPDLMTKLEARHIKLFMAVPKGNASLELSTVDGSSVRFVDGGDGLKSVNFGELLGQIGKTISVASLQSAAEPPYQRALFGQDEWVAVGGWSDRD